MRREALLLQGPIGPFFARLADDLPGLPSGESDGVQLAETLWVSEGEALAELRALPARTASSKAALTPLTTA